MFENVSSEDKRFALIISAFIAIGAGFAYWQYIPYDDYKKQYNEINTLGKYLIENQCIATGVSKKVFRFARGSYFDGFYYKGKVHKDTDVLYYVSFKDSVLYNCQLGKYNISSHYYSGRFGSYNFDGAEVRKILDSSKNKPVKNMRDVVNQ
ncbi:hypothetical protein [Acinetobacter sp. P1(2025)]|uniref:hypothetical protein n=1 Tax=Acinetobacter sp. P1(2025) TaxID=3446120 RepID=UPI003F537E4D